MNEGLQMIIQMLPQDLRQLTQAYTRKAPEKVRTFDINQYFLSIRARSKPARGSSSIPEGKLSSACRGIVS